MNIRPLVVKEYLESLTEKDELNRIFPLLLESMGFQILTKPTENIGLQEYGKDIVAVGKDDNGVKTRFYFELKGGSARNITRSNFYGEDGIHESLMEATYNDFVSAYPKFKELPLKVIIVHNGVMSGSVHNTFENLIIKLRESPDKPVFERWDIGKLTALFSERLFGQYLLTDPETTKIFNRVLVNLNTTDYVSKDFSRLLDSLFDKMKWSGYKRKLPRRWKLLFETLKLISYIIYTESQDYNNLSIAKRYLTHLILRYWYWILKNDLEGDKKVLGYFDQAFQIFWKALEEFSKRTLPIAKMKDGLYKDSGGMYEQVGYTQRTFDYLTYQLLIIKIRMARDRNYNITSGVKDIAEIIKNNSVSVRPLLDIHSLPISNVLELLIDSGNVEAAKSYLQKVLIILQHRKRYSGMLPDANNNIKNVIEYVVTGRKSSYYVESTSPLLAMLMEYVCLFDMKEEYEVMCRFIKEYKITLGIFIPHHGTNSKSLHLIEDEENDLEEQLFSKSVNDGYQSETSLLKDLVEDLSFEDFKKKIIKRKDVFKYKYRTDKAGYAFLRDLAHYYFQTPYFPDKWRKNRQRGSII